MARTAGDGAKTRCNACERFLVEEITPLSDDGVSL
jgi:hypothetical protein